MAKTGIIGHRGAAGLALENSHDSLLAALKHDLDGIEFDIRRTKDNQLVVLHDAQTSRIADEKVLVHLKTLAELQAIKLKNGQHILSLEEVLTLLGGKIPMVIDIKDKGSAAELVRLLAKHPKATFSCTSLRMNELAEVHKARPDIPIFVRDMWNPFEIVHTARQMQATGISLNMWLMNPMTYIMAKRSHLEIRVYTVNNLWLGRWLRGLYPGIDFYTDHPERFTRLKTS